ncbi:hypothetical protein JL721_489 [Aureococcus anophagefferens]|nr:hypothetical protein JL721_489 [Aureococcus anophagefferens]
MGLGLEALGISADDMTPAEAAELSRLLKQSARAYAERQRLARAGEAQRAEHGDGDDFGGKRAAERRSGPASSRVVLWPEYATLADGDVAVHVERHYRPAPAGRGRPAQPRWKVLASVGRWRRRPPARRCASAGRGTCWAACGSTCAASGARRGAGGAVREAPAPERHGRRRRAAVPASAAAAAEATRRRRPGPGGGPAPADDGDADGRDGQSNLEIAGFSVQVAAHARGALYMDTLHSTVAKRSIEKTAPHVAQRPLGTSDLVEGLMGWLTHLGMPVDACGAEQLSEYEADALASYKRVEEAEVGHLVALLIGTAANDVTFGALVSALKVAARAPLTPLDAADGGDSLASDDLDRENIAGFGASAYRDLKRHVVQAAHARGARAFAQHKPLEQQTIMRIATLVDDHGIDLQEVFLDTPVRVGVVRGDVRISFAELRRGLWRLLSCLPPA